jgi:hypothetical protein
MQIEVAQTDEHRKPPRIHIVGSGRPFFFPATVMHKFLGSQFPKPLGVLSKRSFEFFQNGSCLGRRCRW